METIPIQVQKLTPYLQKTSNSQRTFQANNTAANRNKNKNLSLIINHKLLNSHYTITLLQINRITYHTKNLLPTNQLL